MKRLAAFVALPIILSLVGPAAHAQQGLDVVVEFIAGSNLYINAGTESGISADDTLLVYTEANGVLLGEIVVVSATRERAVVAFAGSPFQATRGKGLYVVPKHAFVAPPPQPVAPAERQRLRRSSEAGMQISGRLSLDVNALQTWSTAPEIGSTERTFTTPTARLRATLTHLPGDLRLQVNMRASSRYSSGLVQPDQSFRVYQASLARDWKGVQFQLGRFYNRYETYSGYWDGMLLHFGGDGIGIGSAVGFQPATSNQRFSDQLPKYTVFVNAGHRGRSVRYATDLSFHEIRPRNGLRNHMYAGWSQRLQVGGFQLSQNIQVDRDETTRKWVVTQLLARSAIPLGRWVSLQVRYALRQPYSMTLLDNLITTRRDQGSVGLRVWLGNGSLGADATVNQVRDESRSYTYAGSFSFPNTAILGLGFSSSISYWVLEDRKAVYLSGALSRTFGRVHLQASYYRYQTDGITTVLAHTGDLSLTFPLTKRLYSSLQGRIQRGENLESNFLFGGFWLNF
ncbi:MAG: hypothetical protein OEO20_13735 [Gemmatimonadota bacterium]|nr:hypothetical protein [Gemmatimonadota bacterium]MDH3368226.1 hypothetical protein [Gemmatimonadota bacterium]MDH3479352.1 hypothetical protein [Gemmatimonadota bacterium]MDH3571254.1 hypothetical protein [Gemmatimonadota bacterium]